MVLSSALFLPASAPSCMVLSCLQCAVSTSVKYECLLMAGRWPEDGRKNDTITAKAEVYWRSEVVSEVSVKYSIQQ